MDIIFREPEHIEYASTLGLGVADRAKIKVATSSYDRALALLAIAWLQTTAATSPVLYWIGAVEDTSAALRAPASSALRAARPGGGVARRGRRCDRHGRERSRRAAGAAGSRHREPRRSSVLDTQPWVNANGWRFVQNPAGRFVYELPAGSAALAAAEAAQFDADSCSRSIRRTSRVGKVLAFVAGLPASDLLPSPTSPSSTMARLKRRGDEPARAPQPPVRAGEAPPRRKRGHRGAGHRGVSAAEAANPGAFALKVRRSSPTSGGRCASTAARSCWRGSPAMRPIGGCSS